MTPAFRAPAASLAKLLDLLVFPSFCLLCGRPLGRPGERAVCRDCLDRLTPYEGSFCLCCGRFFDAAGENHLCRRCLDNPPEFSVHRSCGRYRGVLKDVILLYKYRKVSALSRALTDFAGRALADRQEIWSGVDGLVPVPLHRRRRRERGFNQAQLLARELARRRGIGILGGCLVKTRNAPPQMTLRAGEREANVRGAYAVKGTRRLRGKVLLLVDDVFTTGSTLRECSRALRQAGAAEVRALTLAQA